MPKRSSGRRGAARRLVVEKRDYVYNTESYGVTYTLAAGPLVIQAIPLVYSQNTMFNIIYRTPGIEPTWLNNINVQSGASSPAHSKQRIYGVDGWIIQAPTAFNVGTECRTGCRLLHGDMDPTDGDMLTYTGYSMWADQPLMDAAQAANVGYIKEWRWAELASTAGVITTKGQWARRIFWRSRRGITLGNDKGLYMLMESAQGSVSTRMTLFLRTLMRAPLG